MNDRIQIVCKELSGVAPSEIQLIPAGYHKTPKGDFLLDEESAAMVMTAFSKRLNDMVIDYEHQTLEGTEAPASGWIKSYSGLVNKGPEGIWAKGVEWTDRAKQYFANREYRYLSPVFQVRNSDRRVTQLINVALTNQPNIDGMVPLINKSGVDNKEDSSMKQLLPLLGLSETATEADAIVSVNKLLATQTMVNTARTALGLAADADLSVALTKLKDEAGLMANKDVLGALGLKDGATVSEAAATILAMKQGDGQTTVLANKVKTLEDAIAKRDADEAVTLAMKAGKITPAQGDWARKYAQEDPPGFATFVVKAPVAVPTGEQVAGDPPRTDENAQTIANKAIVYQAEQDKIGITVTATEAVAHVMANKGGK